MANNNDKGLYLPLRINLDEWEKSLATADADLQKAMRQFKSSMKDMRLRYDVEIAGAKVAGDQLRALELENTKLNRIYEEQKKAVEALNRAYQQSVKDKGADSKASQDLANQLVRESRELEKIQRQIDSKGLHIGKSLSDGMANISPEFAKVRSTVQGITSSLADMGSGAVVAAKAIGGIGIAAAGVVAVASALDKVKDGVDSIAKAGLEAADPVYQLRESIQGTYADAEFLRNVTAVDGSNAESLANSLTKLVATLKKDEDGTSAAAEALQKYGANLLDAEGNAKSYKEMLIQLSNAAQKAAEAGQYADFKAMLPGAFRTTEFDHLLLGLDGYIEKAEQATIDTKILYEALHEVGDLQNAYNLALKQREAIIGGMFSGAAQEQLRHEIDNAVAINKILDENGKKYTEVAEKVAEITTAWIDMKAEATLVWEEIKSDMVTVIDYFEDLENAAKKFYAMNPMSLFPEIMKEFMGGDYIQEKVDEAKQKLAEKEEEEQHERVLKAYEKEMVRETMEMMGEENRVQQKKTKQQEAEEKKRLEAEKNLQKELRDARASAYEREINAIKDKMQAYIDAGASEVEAQKLFVAQKEAIDKKYYEQAKKERDAQVKQAEQAYQKEVEAAKKAKEATISDAESTTKSNLKLLRYIQSEQKKGTYTEEGAREYANKLYMKQAGYRQSDIDTAYAIGIEKIKELAGARDRLFSRFSNTINTASTASTDSIGFDWSNRLQVEQGRASDAIPQQNVPTKPSVVVNVSFNDTVVEDAGAMQRIADKVADVITPAIEQALRGESQYGY